jgi:hypothetical protein
LKAIIHPKNVLNLDDPDENVSSEDEKNNHINTQQSSQANVVFNPATIAPIIRKSQRNI